VDRVVFAGLLERASQAELGPFHLRWPIPRSGWEIWGSVSPSYSTRAKPRRQRCNPQEETGDPISPPGGYKGGGMQMLVDGVQQLAGLRFVPEAEVEPSMAGKSKEGLQQLLIQANHNSPPK
jgi:hypothetical protein